MWWILVLLTGSLGLYLVIILFLFLFLSGASWQEWLILGIFIVVYLLANKNSTNPEVAKSRRERKMEKKARRVKKAKVVIQSPMGGEITTEDILKKIGEAETVYVRVDQNKAYWVKGDETGSVELW